METNPKPRPMPPRPLSDDELAEELRRQCREEFGATVVLDDVRLDRNDRPGTDTRVMRGHVTKTMACLCAAYMMAIGFSYEMVETSFCCAWWWWQWLGAIVCYFKKYGWGLWSGAVSEGGGQTGGMRPLMREIGFMGDWSDCVACTAISGTANQALALFLKCGLNELPDELSMIPCYGPLLSVTFIALNFYFPLFYLSIVCTKRGENICAGDGLLKLATDAILSGMVFLSETVVNNSVYVRCPARWLGHEDENQPHLLQLSFPAAPLFQNRLVALRIRHSEPRLRDGKALRGLITKLKAVERCCGIPLASSKTNPVLCAHAIENCFVINEDVVKNWDDDSGRKTCGWAFRGGLCELRTLADKLGLIVCVDGKELDIRSLPTDYFKDVGLPETKIELEVRKRMAFDEWIAKNGWLGLFIHLLKNGVFQIDDDQEDVLEGLWVDCQPVHAAIAAKVLETPWWKAARRVKLGTGPLVYEFDAEQLAAIDRESESLWARWFGAGWSALSSLAVALHRKHHWGFQVGANVTLAEEQQCPEATEHFMGTLGTLEREAAFAKGQRVEARWDGGTVWYPGKITVVHGDGFYDIFYDDDEPEERVAERLIREPVLDDELDDELRALAAKALDAEGVKPSSLLRRLAKAVSKAASRASLPRLCSSATNDVVADSEASLDAAEAASGAPEDDDRFRSCFDLARSGAVTYTEEDVKDRKKRPCSRCAEALARPSATKCGRCTKMVPRPRSATTRVRRPPGSTPEFVGVMACNQVMDAATGLRTDGGMTCPACFDAVYLDGGYRGVHATIGGPPSGCCYRKQASKKDSALVSSLKRKLEKLRRQRAVGNIE